MPEAARPPWRTNGHRALFLVFRHRRMSAAPWRKSGMVLVMKDGSTTISLSDAERRALECLIANRNTPAKIIWRARIVLATARGLGTMAICSASGTTKKTVWRWQKRFAEEGIAGQQRDKTGPLRIPPLADAIKALKTEVRPLKEALARLMLENRLLKKCVIADGEDIEGGTPHPRSSTSSASLNPRPCPHARCSRRSASRRPRPINSGRPPSNI